MTTAAAPKAPKLVRCAYCNYSERVHIARAAKGQHMHTWTPEPTPYAQMLAKAAAAAK